MTSTETTRKPVAKEIAERAEALAQEALSTSQQVLAEVRDLKESGVPAMVVSGEPDPKIAERLDKLDGDIDGLVSNLNTLSQAVHAPVMGADGQALDLSTVVVEMRKAFTEHAQKIDANNEAARKAITDLRTQTEKLSSSDVLTIGYEGNPPGAHSMAGLEQDIAELKDQLRQWDEAGLSPASAEDISSLDSRLKALESGGLPQARTSVVAPDGVPAVYRQMHQLMLKVSEIGKDSQADEKMGGYKFRSIDSAMDAVGAALRQVGMMFVPGAIVDHKVKQYEIVKEFANGGKNVQNWTHLWVRQQYSFISLIDGSRIDGIEMDGEARDNGDKSTSKADSMRYKYALLQALCIPIKGLPESDGRDGSEGADASWGAVPAEDTRQDQRRQQQAAEPERGHPVEDEPQGPPPGYEEARTQAQPMAAQKPVDDRTDDEKALAVVNALRDLASAPPAERRARFARIAQGVLEQHLGGMMVDGITINRHLSTANGTLGGS